MSDMTDLTDISSALAAQAIELPSWAFGNSGTRFKVFGSPGTPRDPFEKISDAAQVNKRTPGCPRRSLCTFPGTSSTRSPICASTRRTTGWLGTINSNTFQDDDYKLGSVTHSDPKIRQKAIDHHFACIDVMNETGVAGPEDLARGRNELSGPG
jgi:Predicted sugar isomerase